MRCKYFCVFRATFWPSVVFALVKQTAILLLLCGRCTHEFINIFSCVVVNLEVSFINPTLPPAEMNKKICAEIDHCSCCLLGSMLKVCA